MAYLFVFVRPFHFRMRREHFFSFFIPSPFLPYPVLYVKMEQIEIRKRGI